MKFRQAKSLGSQTNEIVGTLASRVDDQTGDVAARASRVIVLAVRVLRIPTAMLMCLPVPFILITMLVGLSAEGGVRVPLVFAGLVMALVSAAFWGRRRRIIAAVEEPDKLATELGIMVSLSDKVGETRGALSQIAGGGGWRVFGRLQGLWQGVSMTGRWIEGVADLPRARYFGPPKIGTTVTITVAALWLVPVSFVVAFLALIARFASG